MSCNPLRSWWAVFLCPLCFHYGLCVTVFFCFSFCGLIETKEKRQILTKDLFVSWYRYSCLLPPHFFFSKSFFFFSFIICIIYASYSPYVSAKPGLGLFYYEIKSPEAIWTYGQIFTYSQWIISLFLKPIHHVRHA